MLKRDTFASLPCLISGSKTISQLDSKGNEKAGAKQKEGTDGHRHAEPIQCSYPPYRAHQDKEKSSGGQKRGGNQGALSFAEAAEMKRGGSCSQGDRKSVV